MNQALRECVKLLNSDMEAMADQIWEFAEIRYEETKSSALQAEYLERHGFKVRRNAADISTAFTASYGEGHPVIGFLGEFDALPELSQKADEACQDPVREGCPGHGCGHNLLGTAALQAACGLKDYMEKQKIPGTVIYFGCPAEEGGAGKGFMVREGCFEGVDFALTWHPSAVNRVQNSSLASRRMVFRFSGKSAHAASAPWNGRSALDACELMNVGVNYLREHVIPESRMHYAYTNSGGTAPNVVPHQAELVYSLRAPQASYVTEIAERVSDIAKGAALMTGTTVDIHTASAYANILSAPAMEELLMECMREVLPIDYTEEEKNYAETFVKCGTEPKSRQPIFTEIIPPYVHGSTGSTDVGDVSWQLPVGSVNIVTVAAGTVLHSWSAVAQGKSSIAHKGMHGAAEIMALAGLRLLTEEHTRKKIREDFARTKGDQEYVFPLPKDAKPGKY